MPVATKARSHEAAYVVYINGIETPTQSIDVDMGVWKIPTATIQLAPDVQLQRLGAEDRVKVEIFYLDDTYSEVQGREPEFCLLFEGHITGWQYQKSALGRALSFQCTNHLQLMEELYPYLITGLDTIAARFNSNTTANQVSSVHYAPALFVSLLHKGFSPDGERIRRPYDFVENFLRAVADPKVHKELGAVASPNFYGRQMRQINFINRFVPSPILETEVMAKDVDDGGIFPILEALKKDATVKAITNKVMSMGNGTPAWDMIQQLFMMMYYEVLPITTAPMAQVDATNSSLRGTILGPPKWKRDTAKEVAVEGAIGAALGGVAGAAENMFYRIATDLARPNRILNYITKPQWLFGVPPACNTIFPSMIRDFSFTEDYENPPTRVYVNDERLKNISPNGEVPAFATLRVGYPEIVQKELDKKGNPEDGKNEALSGKNFLIWPEEFFRGPQIDNGVVPEWFQFLEDAKKTSKATSSEEGKVTWETLKKIQQNYTKYEYYRTRAQFKSGMATLLFNPYIVPGFPSTIFDGVTDGMNLQAYILNVHHHMDSGGDSFTRVNFTYGQLLSDVMQDIVDARAGNTPSGEAFPGIAATPPQPIESLREVMQFLTKAEDYFTHLFHQNKTYSGNTTQNEIKRAAFYFPQALELVLESGETVFAADAIDDADKAALNSFVGFQPSVIFYEMFQNPDAAMRYVSRPICTLEEYIDFHENNGRRINPIDRFNERQGKGGVYYEEIREMRGGTEDVNPVFDENNNLVSPPIASLPDTRIDWSTKLRNYRNKVMKQVHPQES